MGFIWREWQNESSLLRIVKGPKFYSKLASYYFIDTEGKRVLGKDFITDGKTGSVSIMFIFVSSFCPQILEINRGTGRFYT